MGFGSRVALTSACAVLLARYLSNASLGSYLINIFLLALAQGVGWVVWNMILWPKVFSPLRKLPQPKKSDFFYGQWAKIREEPNGQPMKEWEETIPNDGLILYHLFHLERVLITNGTALQEVLHTKNYDFVKPPQFRTTLGRLLGIGILLAEGDEHKNLYPVFWAKAREVTTAMAGTLREATESDPDADVLEVGGWASRVTLDIIGVAGMGHDFNAIQDPQSELNQCYRHIFQPNRGARLIGLLGLVLPPGVVTRLPIRRNQEINDAIKLIRRVCQGLIDEKRSVFEKSGDTGVDILSTALESGMFTDESLIDQLMTFLAAGHETTASAMSWASYLLCLHPHVQRRLREEIRSSLPPLSDPDSSISPADIDKLPYLNAFCNEVLRFMPPVTLTMRIAAHDTTIVGKPIPKGTMIILHPGAINVSKAGWGEDAHVFNPDRWLGPGRANTGGQKNNYAFLTFLHGPRSCIGKEFAKAEFAILVAAWVGRFEMELADKDYQLDIASGLTSRPRGGLKVRMKTLAGW
ncbi:cytochrome P450 [Trichodelitschia bisporula]|uniref:Cytochrome P450 n=1 Tax=Trichodelitschia bisporula TaxID=703511 RepID=A0A6G1HS76_9PEZI|nr:cytochrome P450 [Trichodelitschia bisporula]